MTESKKLQTALYDLNLDGLTGDTFPLVHDARLAHEMLPVIKQLVDALENSKRAMSSMPKSFGLWVCDIPKIEKAIHSAAPFLDTED